MPLLSDLTPLGLLEFSSEPSEAEKIYDALKAGYRDPKTGQSSLDLSVGTYEEAKLYGWALALGDVRMTLRTAAAELEPETSYYTIDSHEARFKIVADPTATIPERRRVLAARRKAASGSRYEAIVDALQTLLGDDLLAYRPIAIAESVNYPADPSDGPGLFKRPEVPAKSIRLVTPASRVGQPMRVGYINSNAREAPVVLLRGDELSVDPGNWGLAERIIVTDVSENSDGRYFTATFTNAHEANTYATTGNCPLWASNKRHNLIVVTAKAARSAQIRARIDEQMLRMMRAPSTWAIVESTDDLGDELGPFTLGQSALGAVPIEAITVGSR